MHTKCLWLWEFSRSPTFRVHTWRACSPSLSESWLAGQPRAALCWTKSCTWPLFSLKETQISARKAATYSAVWCTSCNNLEPFWRRFAEICSSAIRQVLKLNQHEADGNTQASSKECLEVFSATAGTLFFSLTRLGPMRSQWSILYHLQLGQKAMKTTWLKIPKCSLGLQKSPSYFSFFWPPPRKVILKKKSWQLGRGNCFQIPESQSPLKSFWS